MGFPQITASQSTVVDIPAVHQDAEQRVYDKWWIKKLDINAPDPNGIVSAMLIMSKGYKKEDGSWELSPRSEDTKKFTIEDIFVKAETDPELAQVLAGLLMTIDRIGHDMNIL